MRFFAFSNMSSRKRSLRRMNAELSSHKGVTDAAQLEGKSYGLHSDSQSLHVLRTLIKSSKSCIKNQQYESFNTGYSANI